MARPLRSFVSRTQLALGPARSRGVRLVGPRTSTSVTVGPDGTPSRRPEIQVHEVGSGRTRHHQVAERAEEGVRVVLRERAPDVEPRAARPRRASSGPRRRPRRPSARRSRRSRRPARRRLASPPARGRAPARTPGTARRAPRPGPSRSSRRRRSGTPAARRASRSGAISSSTAANTRATSRASPWRLRVRRHGREPEPRAPPPPPPPRPDPLFPIDDVRDARPAPDRPASACPPPRRGIPPRDAPAPTPAPGPGGRSGPAPPRASS